MGLYYIITQRMRRGGIVEFNSHKGVKAGNLGEIKGLLPQLVKTPKVITLRDIRKILSDSNVYLLTIKDGVKIVGIAALLFHAAPTGFHAHIEDVVIDEAYRGRGLGEKLIQKLMAIAKTKQARYIELTSRPSRVAANHLYQKLGFEKKETNVYKIRL